MSIMVFLAVIGAAMLHACWNALVKSGRETHLGVAAVVLGHAPFAAAGLVFVPAPAPESWPWLAGGIALHFFYQVFLMHAYRIGDLTQVYPLARGSAPLIVALVSVTALGVALSNTEFLAIVLIAAGIISLSLVRRGDGQRNTPAAGLALVTGCFIASYSLVDGLGARAAGTALGFYGWLSIGNGACFAAFMALRYPRQLRRIPREAPGTFMIGGGASFAAYALVIWGFTQAPIALVTALRETSIVFALMIGVFVLRERLSLGKLAATMLTLAGAALLRWAR